MANLIIPYASRPSILHYTTEAIGQSQTLMSQSRLSMALSARMMLHSAGPLSESRKHLGRDALNMVQVAIGAVP